MPSNEGASGFLNPSQMQVPHLSADRDEIVVHQILSTEQEYRVVKPSFMEVGKNIRVDRSQIDALDLGSEPSSCGNDGNAWTFGGLRRFRQHGRTPPAC